MLSKAQILDHVWQYDFGGDGGVVETYIGYLRRKLDTVDPKLIHTVRGIGYTIRATELVVRLSLRARLAGGDGAGRGRARRSSASIVTRTTRGHLIDQIDARLAGRPSGRRPGGTERSRPGPGGRPAVRPTSTSDVGHRRRAGDVSVRPTLADDPRRRRRPSTPAGGGAGDRTRAPFTVGAASGDGVRYRVRTFERRRRRRRTSRRCRSTDVDDTIGQPGHASSSSPTAVIAGRARRSSRGGCSASAIRPIKQMTATAEQHRRRRPQPQRVPEAPAVDRGRRSWASALNHMLERLDVAFDRAGRVAGPPAPVRGRRLPRAAHAGHDDPRLRRAVPRRRAGRPRRSSTRRCGAPSRRPCGWPASSTTCCARQARPGTAAGAAPGRPDACSSPTPPGCRRRRPRPSDHDAARRRRSVVAGDEDRLRQVIANVVGNALVHTPPATPDRAARRRRRHRRPARRHRSRPGHARRRGGPCHRALLPRRPGAARATAAAAGSACRSPTRPSPPTAARSRSTARGEGTTVTVTLPCQRSTANSEVVLGEP